MLETLCFLEQYNVAHGDIKPENILLEGERVTVIDWGLAFEGKYHPKLPQGSPDYLSPEGALLQEVTKSIDVWALACVLLAAYTGGSAFYTEHRSGNMFTGLMESHELRLQRRYPEELKAKSKECYYREPLESFDSAKEHSLERHMLSNQRRRGDDPEEAQALFGVVDKMLTIDPEKRIRPGAAYAELSCSSSQSSHGRT